MKDFLEPFGILNRNAELFVEERKLPHTVDNDIFSEFGGLENKMVGQKGGFCTALVGRADSLDITLGNAPLEALEIDFAVAVDLDFAPF